MSGVLTESSVLQCSHQSGTVKVSGAGASKLTVLGMAVLRKDSVVRTTLDPPNVSGCTNSGGSNQPCQHVTALSKGEAQKLTVEGKPVLLEAFSGATDSVPPGTASLAPSGVGQTKLAAE
jgi:hypothetical protein